MIESGLVRVGASDELPLRNKLDGPLCLSSVRTLLNIGTAQAMKIVIDELSLFSKLGIITTL